MTITQHALLYNFHASNLKFEEIFFLKFLSMQPLTKGAGGGGGTEEEYVRVFLQIHFLRSFLRRSHTYRIPDDLPGKVPVEQEL